MRLLTVTPLLFLLSRSLLSPLLVSTAADSGLDPPGLFPLINKVNILLSTGQFGGAAKVYSEAIDQSPADYLLYYKCATAYFSIQRHSSAFEDFEKVLSLTSNTFDNAHLMKPCIHTREGEREGQGSGGADKVGKGEGQNREGAQCGVVECVCVESASQTLRVASHDVEVRKWRVECVLGAGDMESAVGDLTDAYLTSFPHPSTSPTSSAWHTSTFLTHPHGSSQTTPTLRPRLETVSHLASYRQGSQQVVDELLGKEDWCAVLKLLTGPGKEADTWN